MAKYLRDYLILFLMGGVIIGFDQWTKTLVRTKIPLGGTWMPIEWLRPYVRIVHWYNSGAAFGFFQNGWMVFTILAIIVAGLIIYYFPRTSPHDWTLRLAMGMQFGGAIGNLIDRLRFGGNVTDFISLGTFPVFNVADGSISVGVVVLILGVWLKDRSRTHRLQQPLEHPGMEPVLGVNETSEENASVESIDHEKETRSG